MRLIQIEAYADASQPDLGRVAVLLRGVTAFARVPVLRLRPVDISVLTGGEGQWPEGDLLPSETRVTDDGVELIIGREIAEYPALLPGTAVEIEFPELRLRGECLWPSVPLAARSRRRSIVGKRAPNTPRPLHAAFHDQAPPEAAQANWGVHNGPDAPRGPHRLPQTAVPSAIPLPKLPSQRPATSRVDRQLQPSLRPAPQMPQPPRTMAPMHPDPLAVSANPFSDAPPEPGQRLQREASPLSDRFAWQPDEATTTQSPPPQQHATAPEARKATTGATPKGSRAGLFGLVVGTVLTIEVLLFAVKAYLPVPAGADTQPGRLIRTTLGTAGTAEWRLTDTLQAGAVSPRGIAVQENNPEKFLALANASLHAPGGARDAEEGAYWLKRYVAASLGEERMLRALTQLGTTYAEPPGGPPDFARARQLWEFASAFGDPVAMCFLGALHEHGLGVVAENKAALHWYARAKASGGCPQLEESIARVMP